MVKQPNRKFEEVYDVSDYEIMTTDGWKNINKVCKTIPYEVWEINLENGMYLKGANTHIVFSYDQEVFVKDVKIGQYIDTKNGPSKCIKIKNLQFKENMYDMQVEGEIYYSNGILSHNTTTVGVYCLWYALFNDNKTIGIVSNKESSAKMILARIKRMYESIPPFLKPGVTSYAKTSVEFDNGTKILVSATSPDAFRGETINFLLCDEFAFVPKNQAGDFWASNYPTLTASTESKVVIISTPNGMFNLFHQIYSAAERGMNTFKHSKVSWRRVPGRDEAWKEEQIKDLGIIRFNQEYDVKFLGSVNTVVDAKILESLIATFKEPIHTEYKDKFHIYEKPINGCTYVMGVDVAKGTGEHYSTIQVLKIVSVVPIRFEQVAVFQDNTIDVFSFADAINRICMYYNDAWIMAENNADGSAVVNRLWWDLENSKLVNTSSKSTGLGIRASTKTKPKAVLLMKKLIEDGSLILYDRETMDELSSFVEKNNKFFGENKTDDLVSALYWAVFIVQMQVLDEDYSFKKEENQDEIWGIVPDTITIEEDWSWL